MKKSAPVLILVATSLLFAATAFSQTSASSQPTVATPPPQMSEGDRVWLDVQAAAFMPDFSAQLPGDPAARKAALADRAVVFLRAADRAKDFYTRYPDHAKAGEAKLTEVRALVAASQMGDATLEGRLTATVQALRGDRSVQTALRVQAVSAYAFPKALRGAKDRAERLDAMAQVARSLAVEFPDQPQGAESLVNLAAGSDEATARNLANEVLAMPATPAIKQSAQTLLARLDLVGKPLAAEIDGADLASAKATLTAGRPTIIYTWATWSPGSLRLAADLKKLSAAANFVGLNLDEDTATADALAQKEGLIGQMVYDQRGREGALAQRLKVRGAPEVFLVDAQGVIRDVRGETDLAKKLQSLGL
jgi:hypothetical protein